MRTIKTYFTNLPVGVKWIVGLNVSIYIITLIVSLIFGVSLQDYLGAYPTYSENFNVITIFTSMFVHSMDFTHVLSNMILMLVFAPFVENKLGSKNFIFSYLFIGVMGYVAINHSYHVNKLNITESIENSGLDVTKIKIINGKVCDECLTSPNGDQPNITNDYNYVISKTYGASSSLFGIIVLYVLFNLLIVKKVLYNVLGIYCILTTSLEVFSDQHILNGSQYAHFGGIVGGVVIFIIYKIKKGIV
jgi:membrane associated rhomboid family serine protease